MLPGGFKKDSRVWLHKNTAPFRKGSGCDCDGQRIGSDDPYECVPQDQYSCLEPLITDASGRIYKKDSRTWLHKSSKKKMKTHRGGDLLEERGNRVGWRQESRGLSGGEAPEGVMRTRSSTELIRAQAGVNKIKKKKTMMLMSMMMTPPLNAGGGLHAKAIPETWQQPASGINDLKDRLSAKRASYHDMSSNVKGCTTVSAFASDLCIARKETPPSRLAAQDDIADSDNSNNEMDDDDDGEEEDGFDEIRDGLGLQCQRLDSGVTLLPVRGGAGGGARRPTGWNHSTVEITRDGLRELEKMMKQTQRRSARLAKSLHDRPGQTPRRDVSPEPLSSDSRVSLDANVNLSEELMCHGEADLNQSQNSAEQLTQATEYLYVCSPNRRSARR